MRRLGAMLRRVPPYIFFLLTAVFFLSAAIFYNHEGEKSLAEVGVMGAVGAIAMIVAFRE